MAKQSYVKLHLIVYVYIALHWMGILQRVSNGVMRISNDSFNWSYVSIGNAILPCIKCNDIIASCGNAMYYVYITAMCSCESQTFKLYKM